MIVRVVRHGVYTPLEVDGKFADLETIGHLAHLPDSSHVDKTALKARFVVIDETPTRADTTPFQQFPEGTVFRLKSLRHGFAGPLTFHATGLVVGHLEDIEHHEPGVIPGASGWCTTAVATFATSALGGAAWRAIRDGIFDGVSIGGGFHGPADVRDAAPNTSRPPRVLLRAGHPRSQDVG
jgi:hypothetical protein